MIFVNGKQVIGKVGVLKKKFEDLDKKLERRKKMFERVGIQIVKAVHKNFKEEGHEGKKWEPLKPATIKRRRVGKNKTFKNRIMILQDTGVHLRNTFTAQSTNQSVRVGTPTKFSKSHEKGIWPMPRRPMLPSDKLAHEIAVKVCDNFVAEQIKEAGLNG